MTADKVTQALVEVLKQAQAEPAEQRLFRSGKLAGLFSGRHGVAAEAAAHALREGLLEVVRTETKGKTTIEWVRPTPRAVAFLHDHESPLHVLEELRATLQTTQLGVPLWLGDMRQELQAFGAHLTAETQRILHRLEALGQRVDNALRRLEAAPPPVPNGVGEALPWAVEALAYLDRRQATGAAGDCPLPELFQALAAHHANLSVTAFHDGLRRLHDHRALRLVPFAGRPEELAQPEYALLDGAKMLYHVRR